MKHTVNYNLWPLTSGVLCSVALMLPIKKAHSSDFQEVAKDYLVQDVCVDQNNNVISSSTPLEDRTTCPKSRDLRVGEALPYHKHDWANDESVKSKPMGLQRSDSYPILSRSKLLVVDTFQFDKVGSFDTFAEGDGGQILKISGDIASAIFTQDSKGLKYFFGSNCTGTPKQDALDNTWILFDSRALTSNVSSLTAHLQQTLDSSTCPARLTSAYTEFHRESIRYRADYSHQLTKPLESIVTDHFANTSIERSGSMERMYFTKELGWTRWERWGNMDVAEGGKNAEYQQRADHLKNSGRCDVRDGAPHGIGSWLLLDCREWTNLVKVDTRVEKMSPPTFWIQQLRENPATSYYFAE